MKFRWTVWALVAGFLLGGTAVQSSPGNGQKACGGKCQSVCCKKCQKVKAEDSNMEIMKLRYGVPSTQASTILVTVKDEKSGEEATIVVDHEYWLSSNKALNYDYKHHDDYVKMMVEHGAKPFVVDSAQFAKYKKLAAPEPSAELRALSMRELAAKFLMRQSSGSYYTTKPGVQLDRTMLRLFLEKGCACLNSCLNGEDIIAF